MRVFDYLDYYALHQPGVLFASAGERTLSYADACAESNRVANALIRDGFRVGDRIAILARNGIEFLTLYYGAFKAGVVPVPLNYRLAPPEWSFIARDAGAKALFARGELVEAIDEIRPELETVERFVALEADREGWEAWDAWRQGAAASDPLLEVSADHDLYQMYTSGTTGRPKGAILTHRAVCANLTQIGAALQLGKGERYLLVMPLFHAGAAVSSFSLVALGASMRIHEDFDPVAVVDALSGDAVVATTLVPAMIQACLVHVKDIADRDFGALRVMFYGASPIAEETLRRAMDVFRCDFVQAYGMTETTACATILSPEDHRRALQGRADLLLSAGRPVLGTRVRVVDEKDHDLPPGETGEVLVRGPQLMRGYWKLHEASESALRGGWMHTGDAGTLDEEGYLYVQDRVKDMIVSGGENIYPREIEDVLFRHPALADAAVIGIPDERWGETVMAVVVLREGARAVEDEIIEFCRGQLAGYKRPRRVAFVAELPRNPSGKVLKRELREPYWAGHRRRVGGS